MAYIWDIIGIIGLGSIVAGVGLIYPPAGLITFGLFLVTVYSIREFTHAVPLPRDSGEHDEGAASGNGA